ncbi:MAG: hypothetical protein R2849_22030 [Thermomicrobiales bacterium]
MIGRFRFTEFQLLLVPGIATIVGLLTIYAASTGNLNWDWQDIWISIAFMGAVVAISFLSRRNLAAIRLSFRLQSL